MKNLKNFLLLSCAFVSLCSCVSRGKYDELLRQSQEMESNLREEILKLSSKNDENQKEIQRLSSLVDQLQEQNQSLTQELSNMSLMKKNIIDSNLQNLISLIKNEQTASAQKRAEEFNNAQRRLIYGILQILPPDLARVSDSAYDARLELHVSTFQAKTLTLSASAKSMLVAIGKELAQQQAKDIAVFVGSKNHSTDKTIAFQRASKIASWLVQQGVPAQNITLSIAPLGDNEFPYGIALPLMPTSGNYQEIERLADAIAESLQQGSH